MNNENDATRQKRILEDFVDEIKMRKEKIAYAENLIIKLKAELEFHDRELSNLRQDKIRFTESL
jgi:hypothetical protein|tara:strand:+ start:300 stop:491 length:192 start_codon:yes stop_codon:yes gene_type:complete